MNHEDRYFARRAAEEEQAAERAIHPAAAAAHRAIAARYGEMSRSNGEGLPALKLPRCGSSDD